MSKSVKAIAAALAATVMFLISASACSGKDKATEAFLAINSRCPVKLESGGTLEKVEVTDSFAVYVLSIGMSKQDYDAYSDNMRAAITSLIIDKKKITSFDGPDADDLRRFLLDHHYGLRYIVNGQGGELFTVTIPYDELRTLIENPD